MGADTIAVLVLTVVFLGSIIWFVIHPRRQAERKKPASNDEAEQPPEAETPPAKELRKKR